MKIKIANTRQNIEILDANNIPYILSKSNLLTIKITQKNVVAFVMYARYLDTGNGFLKLKSFYNDGIINVIEIYDYHREKSYCLVENFIDKTINFLKSNILTLLVEKNIDVSDVRSSESHNKKFNITYFDVNTIDLNKIKLFNYKHKYGLTSWLKIFYNDETKYGFVVDFKTGRNFQYYVGNFKPEPKKLVHWQ